jgi:DNA-binding response OmpR family regulator
VSDVSTSYPQRQPAPRSERRLVVLERDTIHRFSTERILRREDYWLFLTENAAAAVRLAAVSAVDLVLVDLGLGLIDAVPASERRRGDTGLGELPSSLGEGYAILRPLQLNPHPQLPIVTLRTAKSGDDSRQPGRFALAGLLPRPWSATGLVDGLEESFLDMIGREATVAAPASSESEWPRPAQTRGLRTPTRARPFESTPHALRSALVVDPDESQRRALADCLIRHDFTVHEATNAEAALRIAVARRPWLIITEAELADASGLEFCTLVRSHSLLCRTPVVFLSECDDCDSRHQALKAGADDYLVKPAPSRELLVRLAARRRSARGDRADGGPRGAPDLQPEPAHRRAARAPRQPVAADRLPARPDRLRHGARPARRRGGLRLHRLAAGPVRVRPRGRRRRGRPDER